MKLLVAALVGTFAASAVKLAHGQTVWSAVARLMDEDEWTEDETSEVLDQISALLVHPINLSTASAERFRSVRLLTDAHIESILSYRASIGRIRSVQELSSLPGLDEEALDLLKYITRIPPPGISKTSSSPNKDIQLTITSNLKRKWSSNPSKSSSSGSPFRRSFRINFSASEVSASVMARNDPFEKFFFDLHEPRYGFDHTSGFVSWNKADGRLRLVAGNFLIPLAHGLVFSSPFGIRYSFRSPDTILRRGSGLRGYSGSNTDFVLRGFGIRVQVLANTRLTAYLSHNRLDGRRTDTKVDGTPVYAIPLSGQHVSDSQLRNKNRIAHSGLGLALEWNTEVTSLGLQYSRFRFDRWVRMASNHEPMQSRSILGFFGSIEKRHLLLSAETEISRKQFGVTAGIRISPYREIQVLLSMYRYAPAALNFYARPFSHKPSSLTQAGLVGAIRIKPSTNLSLASSILFKKEFPARNSANLPAFTIGVGVYAEYRQTRERTIRLLFKLNNKPVHASAMIQSGSVSKTFVAETIRSVSLQFRQDLSSKFRIVLRTDWNHADEGFQAPETGIHISKRVEFDLSRGASFRLQHALYSAPKKANMFYVYEPDVLRSFSAPILSSSGSRTSVVLRIQPDVKVLGEIKWSGSFTRPVSTSLPEDENAASWSSWLTLQLQLLM